MSRTYHHSRRWGPDHRFADQGNRSRSRSYRNVGEAPSWFVRMCDTKPARTADHQIAHKIARGTIDPDNAWFTRAATRKPHTYYW